MKLRTFAVLAAAVTGLSLLSAPAFADSGYGHRGDRGYSYADHRGHDCNDHRRYGDRRGHHHRRSAHRWGRDRDDGWHGHDRRRHDRDGYRGRRHGHDRDRGWRRDH
jgi:hypothetical protein